MLVAAGLNSSATTRYVDQGCTNPVSPFLDWSTAATNIQDAIDAAVETDLILVTNGVYRTGGRVMAGDLTNRVALDKALTVQSVNGPFVTVIQGAGATNGSSAVRCAWLTNGAALVGFKLQAGATRSSSDNNLGTGGGAWCASSNAMVANCLIISNNAHSWAGGAYQGTLNNCLVTGNATTYSSGAVHSAMLNNCTVVSNWSFGVSWASSRLTNCIVYYNASGNLHTAPACSYCCTTPLVSGTGNFTNAPQLFTDGHLYSTSPCRGAGTNLATGTDFFGKTWLNPPSIGCAEWDPMPRVSIPRLQLTMNPAAVGFTVNGAATGEPPFTYSWFKDGIPLQDDDHFTSCQTSNLVATGVRLADTGAYQLVVSNVYGFATSAVSRLVIHCVDPKCATPTAPYTDWSTAATNIQDAIDAAVDTALVLVTNGVYATGGRVMAGDLTNRVALYKPLTVQSVSGPSATVIQGVGATNGTAAVRCAWLADGASLIGFTLTAGATRSVTDTNLGCGGGAWCSSSNATVANCLILSNTAYTYGGGTYLGSLNNCLVAGNTCALNGGAAYSFVLNHCTVVSNSNCGVYWSLVPSARLTNCIVYYNSIPNYNGSLSFSYCCTTALPSGPGNFANAPQFFLDCRLNSTSPCRGSGTNTLTGTDFFGTPWLNPPSVGYAEFDPIPIVTPPRVQLANGPIGFSIGGSAIAGEPPLTYLWLKDGIPLQDNGHFSSCQSTNLVATGITFADAGAYQLVVSNAFGSVTSAVAPLVIHCVDAAGASPAAPYTSWGSAATNMQDAIDVALTNEVVLVTNGLYTSGGKAMGGTLTNRVALTRPITVASVNGPFATVIQGAWDPATTNGPLAVRCAWLTNGATLSGFTLRNGATQPYTGVVGAPAQSGGGAWCSSTNGVVANCVLTNNAAVFGGGISQGTLNNSLVVRNLTTQYGGGAYGARLNNCTVMFNFTTGVMPNCGAGTYDGITRNSIVQCNFGYYLRLAVNPDDHAASLVLPTYYSSCTSTNQRIAGTGNFDADAAMLDLFHISLGSPCRAAGNPACATGTDLDGEPWSNPPSIGCDEPVLANITGPMSLALDSPQTNVLVNHVGFVNVQITGRPSLLRWDFGDGTVLTNLGTSVYHRWSTTGDFPVTCTAYNADNPNGVSASMLFHIVPVDPPRLEPPVVATNAFGLQFMAQTGAFYYIQYATSLTSNTSWQLLKFIGNSPGGIYQFFDSGVSNNATRFYRVLAE